MRNVPVLLIALSISACGGGSAGENSTPLPPPAQDSVSHPGSTPLTLGVAASLTPNVTGPATIPGWSVNSPLPAGLSLDSTTVSPVGLPPGQALRAITR
jgi:hypothetical protein